ncbi:30S ribosomal protein S20 [candidate division WWE3 bacterium]|uniref:Small ribosomal subunit protein bS20 n=1 Tax=candidate division WWE3 bacterium TaxID=2053526 RepID=A0A955RNX8_UNCKA|nr:30S ribosomal protein S20 [candidate division WWE3 bacterium]
MPNTASATKALRQSKRRKIINNRIRTAYRTAVKKMRLEPTLENMKAAASTLDKAAKRGVIKQGKADRLKSRLSILIGKSK